MSHFMDDTEGNIDAKASTGPKRSMELQELLSILVTAPKGALTSR